MPTLQKMDDTICEVKSGKLKEMSNFHIVCVIFALCALKPLALLTDCLQIKSILPVTIWRGFCVADENKGSGFRGFPSNSIGSIVIRLFHLINIINHVRFSARSHCLIDHNYIPTLMGRSETVRLRVVTVEGSVDGRSY